MSKETSNGKSVLTAGAAMAFAGAALYATGKVLSFLFRDVDPEKIEERAEAQEEIPDEDPEED